MTAPVWEPGKIYLTGAIVRPTTTAAVTTGTITNPDFEDGDTGWQKDASVTIVNQPGFSGAWCARVIGASGSIASEDRFPCTPGQSITASCMGKLPQGSAGTSFDCNLNWYDASGALIGTTESTPLIRKDGANWRKSTVTGTAPAGAAFFTVRGDGNVAVGGEILLDTFKLDSYVFATPTPGLVYKAVQPDPGTSAASEPVWPPVLGQQVNDGTVIWEAVATRRVTWKAIPTMKSGATEPDWPTAPGGTVLDGSIIWTASSRRVEDERCPNSKVVTIAASKIFAVDKDIVAYSATVNPLDWSSRDNAGYLPTGLQQYGANDMAVLGLYGSNLMAFNSQGFQMWQVDEDPANMSLLDARPIGSTFPKAIAPVANDLFFLTELGVRTVGIAGGSTNLQASDAGAPIDPLVQEALPLSPDPIAMFYPSLGQYWLMMREPEPEPPAPSLPKSFAYISNRNDLDSYEIGLVSVSDDNFVTHLARKVYTYGFAINTYNTSLIQIGGTIIACIQYAEYPQTIAGIVALEYDGSSTTLVEKDIYKLSSGPSLFYWNLLNAGGGVFYAYVSASETGQAFLKAFSYSHLTGITEIGSTELPDDDERYMCLHNGYIISAVLDGSRPKVLSAYQYSNGEFTLVSTYAGSPAYTSSASKNITLRSDGSRIYTSAYQAFTFDGTTFVNVADIPPNTQRTDLQISSGNIFIANQSSLWSVDNNLSTVSTLNFPVSHNGFTGFAARDGKVYIPAGKDYSQSASGIYSYSGGTFTRLGHMSIETVVSPTAVAVFPISAQTG